MQEKLKSLKSELKEIGVKSSSRLRGEKLYLKIGGDGTHEDMKKIVSPVIENYFPHFLMTSGGFGSHFEDSPTFECTFRLNAETTYGEWKR